MPINTTFKPTEDVQNGYYIFLNLKYFVQMKTSCITILLWSLFSFGQNKENIQYVYDYCDDLARFVTKDYKFGFLDRQNNVVIPPQFEQASDFNFQRALVSKKDSFYIINNKGEYIQKLAYDNVEPPSEGYMLVSKNGKIGFIDVLGNEVIQPSYDYAFNVSEAKIAIQKQGLWGFIDTKQNEIIPCIYQQVFNFSQGLSPVKLNGKWGYINSKGEIVIPFEYDSAFCFSEGVAVVTKLGEGFIIDSNGTVLHVLGKTEFYTGFQNGGLRIKKEDNYYFIDRFGKIMAISELSQE